MKPLSLALAVTLAAACHSNQPARPAEEVSTQASVSAMRTGDVVVTTRIEEQGDEIYELLVEIERIHENGSREVLGTPRVLLTSGQVAEIESQEGQSKISVQATLPDAGDAEQALIEVAMFEGSNLTAAPRVQMPMPTVTIAGYERPAGDAPAQRISVAFLDEDVRTVITTIAHQAEKNVIISENIQGTVTLNVRDVPWYRALQLALEPLALRATTVAVSGDVLSIDRSPTVTQHCQVWLNFVDEDFERVVAAIAEQAHINVIASPGIAGAVTLRAEGVSWLTALETAAEAVGCTVHVSPDGTLVRITPA